MQGIIDSLGAVYDQAIAILLYPSDSSQRIFWLYVLSSVVVAYFVYRAIKAKGSHATARDSDAANGTFLQFLFPRSVWSHPSAWLDLRYFVFHHMVVHFLLLVVGGFGLVAGYQVVSDGHAIADMEPQAPSGGIGAWALAAGFMFVVFFVLDFVSWTIHYLQHKVPLLWQFHKVHHSAEVMHPISNYREHPVDNVVYAFFTMLFFGMMYGAAQRFFGVAPTMPTFFGIPLMMFLFNIVAYNLRHSHVWLRWPGIWSVVFPSPAHHHVHHSCHPDHIDKNFAFMFPVFDKIFGTYEMPEDNRDVKFGVPEDEGRDLDGVLKLYWVPFRDAYRLFRPKKAPAEDKSPAGDTVNFPAE